MYNFYILFFEFMDVVDSDNIICGPWKGLDTWNVDLIYGIIWLMRGDNGYPCSWHDYIYTDPQRSLLVFFYLSLITLNLWIILT